MRLIDADALKKRFEELHLHPDLIDLIDNAPTVEPLERIGSICDENCGYRPHGKCEDCKHFKESLCENSPEGWCSILRVTQEGNLETQVPKDYYCSWFEKGGAE